MKATRVAAGPTPERPLALPGKAIMPATSGHRVLPPGCVGQALPWHHLSGNGLLPVLEVLYYALRNSDVGYAR